LEGEFVDQRLVFAGERQSTSPAFVASLLHAAAAEPPPNALSGAVTNVLYFRKR
jgi:hypothetical protein